MVSSSNFLIRIHTATHTPLHVGLAGANPNFTHQDILEGNGFLRFDLELSGAPLTVSQWLGKLNLSAIAKTLELDPSAAKIMRQRISEEREDAP